MLQTPCWNQGSVRLNYRNIRTYRSVRWHMFLQLGHMKNNIMDASLSWEIQLVRNNANSLQDFVRSKEME
jgi:hypothetical protein